MSRRSSILKGDDLDPANFRLGTPDHPEIDPLMRQLVTPPSIGSSQSEDTDKGSLYSKIRANPEPRVAPRREEVPPGHVRLLGGYICPSDGPGSKEDDLTEGSVYHCPVEILEPKDAGEFPGENTQGDDQPEEVTSLKAPQRPMLYLRGISTPPAPAGPASSPFQGVGTLYQGINPYPPQDITSYPPQPMGPDHLHPVGPMSPHHAMNPPSPDFVQPIIPYHPKPIGPGLPEPISPHSLEPFGPHPSQPIGYHHAEPIDPHPQAFGPHAFQPMGPHYPQAIDPDFVEPTIPYHPQAVAIYHRQPIGCLDQMLSSSPHEAPTPTPPQRRSITFNPEASEFTPSPTGPGTNTHEEGDVQGFGELNANFQASMAETVQGTYSQILTIEDERDREDAINDFYYAQARPWTDEDTRREKEEQELEERKRRFGRR